MISNGFASGLALAIALGGCPDGKGSAPAPPDTRPRIVVAGGNSLTRGYGGQLNYDWPLQLSQMGIVVSVTNLGCDGRTTTDMLNPASVEPDSSSGRAVGPPYFTQAYVDGLLDVTKHCVFVFEEIGNDVSATGGNVSIAQGIANYRAYCANRHAAGWASVGIINLAPRPSLLEADRATINADIAAFVAANSWAFLIDISGDARFSVGANTNENSGTQGHYFYDTTHQNSSGLAVKAGAVAAALRARFGIVDSFAQLIPTADFRASVAASMRNGGAQATNGQQLDAWNDNGAHAANVASTTTFRPTLNTTGGPNSHPAVVASGSNIQLSSANVVIGCFSFYAYVKLTAAGVLMRVGTDYAVGTNTSYIYTASGSGQTAYTDRGGSETWHNVTSMAWATDGAWHLVEFHYEGTHASVEFYVDGVLMATTNGTGTGDPGGQDIIQKIMLFGNGNGTAPVTGSGFAYGVAPYKHNAAERARARALYAAEAA